VYYRRITNALAMVAGLSLGLMLLTMPAASASLSPQPHAPSAASSQHRFPTLASTIRKPDFRKAGWFQIRNESSGKCLDDTNGQTNNGNPMQMWTCNGSTNQNWTFYLIAGCVENWPCEYVFYNEAAGKCLDLNGGSSANGTKVQIWSCTADGSNNNQWWVPVSTTSATWQFYQNLASRTDMVPNGGSTANGTRVIGYNPPKLVAAYFWECTPAYCA
jgi:hypothetical protein